MHTNPDDQSDTRRRESITNIITELGPKTENMFSVFGLAHFRIESPKNSENT